MIRRRSNGQSCDIILPYEITKRELPGLMLLAGELAARGATVAIGAKNNALACLATGGLSFGAFFYKHGVAAEFQTGAMLAYGQDPEAGLAFHDAEDFISLTEQDFRDASHVGATYFAYGAADLAAIQRRCSTDLRVELHGSPMAQMWRDPGGYYEPEMSEIQRSYTDFLLFCSTEALSSPVKKKHASNFARKYPDEVSVSAAIFRGEVEAVAQASRRFPDLHIIVRPHPVERPDRWFEATKQLRNVSVDRRFSAMSWIRTARAVIHNGSTIAIGAQLAGATVLNYAASESLAESGTKALRQLPRRVSHDVIGTEALCDAIEAILSGAVHRLSEKSTEDLLANRLHWPQGGPARGIAKRIEADFMDFRGYWAPSTQRYGFREHRVCKLRREKDHKIDALGKQEVENRLELLAEVLPENVRYRVDRISHGAFLIRST